DELPVLALLLFAIEPEARFIPYVRRAAILAAAIGHPARSPNLDYSRDFLLRRPILACLQGEYGSSHFRLPALRTYLSREPG
ncbi:MAG: hypothetical protein ABI837_09875, partial [Acidobacteriota bacterium]